MNTLTQPLREEHQELLPHIENILQAAEKIGEVTVTETCREVDEVYDFLAYHLKPHAEAEEAALYPVVQKLLGGPDATKTMSRDHVEVGHYIEQLAAVRESLTGERLTAGQVKNLQRMLYGVYALVKIHFAKEEEVYLPILDQHLTPESARELFEAMETAAHEAKQTAGA